MKNPTWAELSNLQDELDDYKIYATDMENNLKQLHEKSCRHIEKLKSELDELKNQLIDLRGEAICPNCGDGYETLNEANGCCR